MSRKSKLDLQDILERLRNKQSIPSIARDYGVHRNTVRHFLVTNNCKRHVTYECESVDANTSEVKTA